MSTPTLMVAPRELSVKLKRSSPSECEKSKKKQVTHYSVEEFLFYRFKDTGLAGMTCQG